MVAEAVPFPKSATEPTRVLDISRYRILPEGGIQRIEIDDSSRAFDAATLEKFRANTVYTRRIPEEDLLQPPYPQSVPKEIVDAAVLGDVYAMGNIVAIHNEALVGYMMAHTSYDDAQDNAQTVWYNITRHVLDYEDQGLKFEAWLYAAARNQVASYHRKESYKRKNILQANRVAVDAEGQPKDRVSPVGPEELVADADPTVNPEQSMERTFWQTVLTDKIKRLPPTQQTILFFRYNRQYSVKETAEATGKTENSVKVLNHKAIARIATLMRKDGYTREDFQLA